VLIPALGDFERKHPELDLRIETSSTLVDLRGDAVDATVRYGSGPWEGHAATVVADMSSTVVTSPSSLRKAPLDRIEDLRKHTLLYVDRAPDYWGMLANAVGFEVRKKKAFDSYLATLQAAAHGAGVALGLFPLSAAWLRDGRLCTPLPDRFPSFPYHFVTRPGDASRPEFVLVREWIQGCFAKLAEEGGGR
jgi:LysR family glycine cleavage system transcriptional activator